VEPIAAAARKKNPTYLLIMVEVLGGAVEATRIAAVCLVVLMIGAMKAHVDHTESAVAPGILALLGVFVALGRFGVARPRKGRVRSGRERALRESRASSRDEAEERRIVVDDEHATALGADVRDSPRPRSSRLASRPGHSWHVVCA
jgi:hypothetical protein